MTTPMRTTGLPARIEHPPRETAGTGADAHAQRNTQGTHVPITQDPAMIERAASIYRAAASTGMAPTKTAAAALGVSIATAGRLISAARASGDLPPAVTGRATYTESAHRPRMARWTDSSDSWLCCAACRHPWPCAHAETDTETPRP